MIIVAGTIEPKDADKKDVFLWQRVSQTAGEPDRICVKHGGRWVFDGPVSSKVTTERWEPELIPLGARVSIDVPAGAHPSATKDLGVCGKVVKWFKPGDVVSAEQVRAYQGSGRHEGMKIKSPYMIVQKDGGGFCWVPRPMQQYVTEIKP